MMSLRPETAVSGPNLTLKTDITCEDPTSLLCRAQQLQEVGWSSETSERKANIISSPTTSLVESPTITMCGESAVREHQTSSNLGSPLVFVWNSGAASPTSSINQLEYSRSDQIVEGAAEQLKKLGGDDTWDRGPCSSKEKEVQEKPLSPQTTAPVKQSMWDGLQDDIIAAWSRPIEEECDVRWGAHVESSRDPSANEEGWSDLKHASYFQISAKDGNQDDSVFIADTVSEQKSRSPVPGGGVSDPRASPDFPPHFDGVSAFPEPQTIANPELKAFVASPTESVSSGCVSDLTLNVDCDNSGDDLLNVSGRYDKIDFGFESTGSPLVSPCNGRGRSPSELPRIVVNGKNANSKQEAPVDPYEDLASQSVSAPHSDIASWGDDRRSPVECVQNAGNHRRSRQITLELFEAANDIVSVSERRASIGNDASSFSRFPARDMTSRSFKDSHEDIRLESCPFSARNNNLRDESPRRPESRMGNRSPERMIRPPSRIGEEHEVEQDSVRFISSAEDLSYRSRLISSSARVERIHTRGMIELTAGLKNLTNTCYMNSAIQALAHCIPFARFFVRNEYIHSLRDTKRSTLCVLFAQLLTALWRKWDTTKVLKLFCRQIKMRCPMYRNFEQQDSHEFLLNFLTLLHEDLNVAPKSGQKAPCDVPDSIVTSETFSERFNNFIAAHEDRERSIVTSNFEGVLASRLKCLTCEKDSFTFEEFTVLSIPVPCHRRKLDLQACLDEFFKVETVDEWRCPHCEEKRTALKELRIAKLPQNLIIHFIRGNAPMIPFMMLMREVNNRVHFTEDLDARDIAQYLCNKDVQKKNYTLYAIVKHFGNLNSGHYIAECRSLARKNQPWVRYSDDAVSLATYPIDVDNAFMLFFSSIPQQLSTFASSLSE